MGKPKGRKADFQKVKLKIGRRLPKGLNITDTSFKSKKIVIREQILKSEIEGVTNRKRGIKELLSRLQHYNPGTRHESLVALKDLLNSNPNLVKTHIAGLIERVCELLVDKNEVVRKAVIAVLKEMMKHVPHDLISPFFPIITSYLCCAMTHILIDIQRDSLQVLDLLLVAFPGLTVGCSRKILNNFLDQISADNGESQARTLLVKPGEKLTSQKWRLEILQRIQRFLLALLDNWEPTPNCNVNNKIPEIEWDGYSPLSVKLYKYGLNPCLANKFSLYQWKEDTSPSKDSEQAHSFMVVLLPLMVQTWIEASPEKSSHKSGSILSQEAADILDCVLQVIRSLAQWMEKIHNDKPEKDSKNVEWLQDVFFKEFVNFFMKEFPYSPVRAATPSKKGKNTPQISFISLNLMICEILVLLRPDLENISSSETTLYEVVVEYLSRLMLTEKLQGTNIFTIVRIIQCITKNNTNHDFTKKLLEKLWMLYKNLPSSRKERVIVETLFMELVTSPQLNNLLKTNCLSSWLELLPSDILSSVDSPDRLLELLKNASHIASCRYPAFTKGLQSCDSKLIALLDNLPFSDEDSLKGQRYLINIIYSLPTISDNTLRQLAAVIRSPKLHLKNFDYMLQILSYRFQRSENTVLNSSQYLSLLLCIEFGVFQHEAQMVQQGFICDPEWQTLQHTMPQVADFVVVPTDCHTWDRHQHVNSKVLRQIFDFPESFEIQKHSFNYIKQIFEQFRYIPAHTASGIFALVSPILRETEMEENSFLDNDFQFSLNELVLATLTTACALSLTSAVKPVENQRTNEFIMDIAVEFIVETECIEPLCKLFQRNLRGLKKVSEIQGHCLGLILSKLLRFEEPEGESLHSMGKALQIIQSLTESHRSRNRWWNELVHDFKIKTQMSSDY